MSPRTTAAALKMAGKAMGGNATAAASGFNGKINIYCCEACRGHIVTRDLAEGVTPFLVQCEATDGCKGKMQSSLYRVFDQKMLESHEWYRPEAAQELAVWEWDHVSRGGLLLRKRQAVPA